MEKVPSRCTVYRAGTQWNQNYVPNNTVVCSQAQLVLTANQHQAKVQRSLLHNNDNMRCVTATKKHNKQQRWNYYVAMLENCACAFSAQAFAGLAGLRVFCAKPCANWPQLGTAVPNSPYHGTHSANLQETKRMAPTIP